jgi:hypothetical protein
MADPDTTVKKSLTIPRSLSQEIEARTGAGGFSRFMTEAAQHHLALIKAAEITEAHQQEHGAFSAEERAAAEQAWHGE